MNVGLLLGFSVLSPNLSAASVDRDAHPSVSMMKVVQRGIAGRKCAK